MPAVAQPRVLVHRRVDGWLVGWLAVFVWIAVFVGSHLGIGISPTVTALVFWAGAVATAAHFGLSYHLAYSGGMDAVRKRPLVLAIVPAALVVVLGIVLATTLAGGSEPSHRTTSFLIATVYLMTIWHYVKQVYGVGRVGAGFGGIKLSEWDVRILRYGLYPLWFVGASRVLISNSFDLGGYRYGYPVLPFETFRLLQFAVAIAAVPVAAVFVRVALQRRALPPSTFLAPYVAAFLWLGLPTDPALTALLLAAFHALQYLAVGHRAELAVGADRPGSHGPVWWLNIFVGAACGGLLASRWLPAALDARFAHGQLLFGVTFFVFLNIHHYAIDASIWRTKGELIKAMGRKPAAKPAPSEGGALQPLTA